MHTKLLALCAFLVAMPLPSSAATTYSRTVPYSPTWFPSVYVHTGASIDVQLEQGDVLLAPALVGDKRWYIMSVTAGPSATPHIVIKPEADISDVQMVTIPTSRHQYHVLLRSGAGETSTYTLVFFDNAPRRTVASAEPGSSPTDARRPVTINACAPPLYTHYRIHGDARIPVDAVCDDGIRTYVLLRPFRAPAAVPYRVDPGGHQDQIVNPTFTALTPGANPRVVGEWVLDGVFDSLALVADSSRGQIRTNITREAEPHAGASSPEQRYLRAAPDAHDLELLR